MGAALGGSLAASLTPQRELSVYAQDRLPTKPNIIFVLADDLGYGDLGCYGQQVITTPYIDKMALEGMRFSQCYAGSTVCAPSRCALMTGMHTGHCYVRGNKRVPLRPSDRTLAEVMKDAGYVTGLVGKWGLGLKDTTGIPTRQGFDEFYGYLDQRRAHTYYPTHLWRNEQQERLEGNVESQENVATERAQYSHDLMTKEALSFLNRHKDRPFFLYLAYTIPHANNERGRALGDGMEVPDYGDYAKTDWPNPQKGHAAMISRLDRDVGRLFDHLKELGIDENTIVFFTSDNGTHKEGGADPEFFNSSGPLRGHKRALYEGGIRVPMIVRWPGVIAEDSESDLAWAFWDFMPTAAALAKTEVPDDIDGLSVIPTLIPGTGTQEQHDHLYWEFHEGDFLRAARKGPWKAVLSRKKGKMELYNLDEDLGEQHDIVTEQTAIATEMRRLLDTARTPSEHWPT